MRGMATTLALVVALGGCAARTGPVAQAGAVPTRGWEAVITATDRAAIDAIPATWTRALAGLTRAARARMQAEGAPLDPAGALDLPALPPGPYHCRLLRFDSRGGLAGFKPDFCAVTGDSHGVALTKQTGSNLPGGWLHDDGPRRQIFLGTLRRSVDNRAPGYGGDPEIDVAGVVERVAPFRWRLVLTKAGRGALLDVYELVPVAPAAAASKG